MREGPISEQNILNETPESQLNPDFPLDGEGDDLTVIFRPRVGPVYRRDLGPSPHRYNLQWVEREQWVADQIRQWYAQYATSYFTFNDFDRNRTFTGNFISRPKIARVSFNRWNISAVFLEVPSVPMLQYPDDWETDGYFIDETDIDNNPLVKADPGWLLEGNDMHHGAKAFITDSVGLSLEWIYDGYGFRLYGSRLSFGGIAELRIDDTVVSNIDFYSPTTVNSNILFTKTDVPFGRHRVKLVTLGTHNVSSTGFRVIGDAIEVMQ